MNGFKTIFKRQNGQDFYDALDVGVMRNVVNDES